MNPDLHDISVQGLRGLAGLCRESHPALPSSLHAIRQVIGTTQVASISGWLDDLRREGWTGLQTARLFEAVIEARRQSDGPLGAFDLVLSGPELIGVPTRDTSAVIHSLIAESQEEVLLVGYAVYGGRVLFEQLANRMAVSPNLDVRFYLDISRRHNDTSLSDEIVRRFARDFVTQQWPWTNRPKVFYDPRSLDAGPTRSSLHAKCVVVDRRVALVTSANFTEAAQKRNIEVGVLLRHDPTVRRLAAYFEGLQSAGVLRECRLPAVG